MNGMPTKEIRSHALCQWVHQPFKHRQCFPRGALTCRHHAHVKEKKMREKKMFQDAWCRNFRTTHRPLAVYSVLVATTGKRKHTSDAITALAFNEMGKKISGKIFVCQWSPIVRTSYDNSERCWRASLIVLSKHIISFSHSRSRGSCNASAWLDKAVCPV